MSKRRSPMLGLLAAALALLTLSTSLEPAQAATLIVNTTADTDDGVCNAAHCSLREAINAANVSPGPDTIAFNVPGPGIPILWLCKPLPPLTDNATTLDGTTQPGYHGSPLIEIRPALPMIGCPSSTVGLRITSSSNVVRAISWVGFHNGMGPYQAYADPSAPAAILITGGTDNRIEANYIGLTPLGTALPNTIGVRLGAPGQTLQGNVVSANTIGIHAAAPNQVIQGNRIGTDATGTGAVGNGWGIRLDDDTNRIGGAAAGQGNLISGNGEAGIFIGVNSEGNEIYGNRIGTDLAGAAALGNQNGIFLWGNNNRIGGPGQGQANVISGNSVVGIRIEEGSNGSLIQGNLIGSDVAGDFAVPNGAGIRAEGSNTIGGLAPGEGNLILGNSDVGIFMGGLCGTQRVLGNVIRLNSGHGVDTSCLTTISRNSIFNNGLLGIFTDHGPPAPILTEASISSVSGTTCAGCLVEIFLADLDPSGAGEGKTFLTDAVADPAGTFSAAISGVPFCAHVTATTTDLTGDTSAFAENLSASPCLIIPPYLIPLFVAPWVVFGSIVGVFLGRRRAVRPMSPALLGGGAGALAGVGLTAAAFALPFVQLAPSPEPQPPSPPVLSDGALAIEQTVDAIYTLESAPTPTPTRAPTNTPAIIPTTAPTPTTGPVYGILTINAFCRRGPGLVYDIVTGYPTGHRSLLDGRNQENSWFRFQEHRCWTSGVALEFEGDPSTLPILPAPPTPTPSPTPAQGCWVRTAAGGTVCQVPCPPSARPGGTCTP